MGRVSGKVVIVTGAARGMGAVFAQRLIDEGAKVMLTDVLDADGKVTATELGANARFTHHDVSKEAEWQRVVSETEAAFGPVTVLVSNAGIVTYSLIENLEAYTASKFAVRGMTKSAAIEFAPHNIRVNSIHPGIIRTPMTAPTKEAEAMLADVAKMTPAGRWGDPMEVANVVLMLATDETKFSTGAEFVVDGGMCCQ